MSGWTAVVNAEGVTLTSRVPGKPVVLTHEDLLELTQWLTAAILTDHSPHDAAVSAGPTFEVGQGGDVLGRAG